MSWKVEPLKNCLGKQIFDSKVGYIILKYFSFKSVHNTLFFIIDKSTNKFTYIDQFDSNNITEELYTLKNGKNINSLKPDDYLNKENFIKVNIFEEKVNIWLHDTDNYRFFRNLENVVLGDFLNSKILVNSIVDKPIYIHPNYDDLKIGESYFLSDKGICKITKIQKQTNKLLTGFITVEVDNETFVLENLNNLFNLPNNVKENPLNNCLDEYKFNVRTSYSSDSDTLDIIWDKINEASSYKIKMYYVERQGESLKYSFLKDYNVLRNENYLHINDVVYCSSRYFVLIAEDREGNIIAQTRAFNPNGTFTIFD